MLLDEGDRSLAGGRGGPWAHPCRGAGGAMRRVTTAGDAELSRRASLAVDRADPAQGALVAVRTPPERPLLGD